MDEDYFYEGRVKDTSFLQGRYRGAFQADIRSGSHALSGAALFPRCGREAVRGGWPGEAPLIYAVEDKEGGFAGYVIYHKYEEDGMELGWVLKREVWHKGYADKLTEMLLKDAVGKAAYAVIECAPEQKATRRIAVKHGFVYRGRSEGCDVYIRRFEKTLDSHITS